MCFMCEVTVPIWQLEILRRSIDVVRVTVAAGCRTTGVRPCVRGRRRRINGGAVRRRRPAGRLTGATGNCSHAMMPLHSLQENDLHYSWCLGLGRWVDLLFDGCDNIFFFGWRCSDSFNLKYPKWSQLYRAKIKTQFAWELNFSNVVVRILADLALFIHVQQLTWYSDRYIQCPASVVLYISHPIVMAHPING